MNIQNLFVKDFRNLKMDSIELDPRLNILIGSNGEGKTSVLEALYVGLRGYSFRPGGVEELVNFKSPKKDSFISMSFIHNELSFKSLVSIQDKSKKHFLNQKPFSSMASEKQFPVVLFTPESLLSIKEGPEKRRNLVDEIVKSVQPGAVETYKRFDRVYKQRSRLLKIIQKEKIESHRVIHEQTLKSLNVIYLKLSEHITNLRIQTLMEFVPVYKQIAPQILNMNVEISVEYLVSDTDASTFLPEQVHQVLYKRALELKESEIASGKCLVGPHKHDIKILFNGVDSRYFCSQGQQRALILAFLLASVRIITAVHKKPPLLLLDDVLSELDLERRWYLIKYLKTLETQIILTGTDVNLLEQFGDTLGALFTVQNGKIEKVGQLNREETRV